MFRTIKLKLPYDRSLIETAKQFREAVQMVLGYLNRLRADGNYYWTLRVANLLHSINV